MRDSGVEKLLSAKEFVAFAAHPDLALETGRPIGRRGNPSEVFHDVVLGDLAHRDLLPVGVGDGAAEDLLTNPGAFRVVKILPMRDITHAGLHGVDELVDGDVIIGFTAKVSCRRLGVNHGLCH